jgi:hypothetical protein
MIPVLWGTVYRFVPVLPITVEGFFENLGSMVY